VNVFLVDVDCEAIMIPSVRLASLLLENMISAGQSLAAWFLLFECGFAGLVFHPPAIAPTIQNASAPDATASARGASGGSFE